MSGAVVSFMKSSGGVGATALAVQMACAQKGELALLDLDIQFGAAAFQMDVASDASIIDLVSAPERLDPAMVKGAMVRPHERFDLLAAPQGIHPIDLLTPDGVIRVIDVARETYSAVLLDLPEVWTEWSYAALARSSRIILVTRLTIPSLRQARRQMDMIKQENLGHIPLYVIANQVQGGLLSSTLTKREGEAVLGRAIDFTVSNDGAIQLASDSGLPLAEVPGGGANARKMARIIEDVLASRRQEGEC
jgi:pilus assembly protein CpaE